MTIIVDYTVVHKLLNLTILLLTFLLNHMDWKRRPSGYSYLVSCFFFSRHPCESFPNVDLESTLVFIQ